MAYIRRNSSALILAPKLSDSGPQTSKSQKRYMNELQSEVTKSRIAIENISQRKALDQTLYKKIDELKKQLHKCIVSINHESSKNTIMKELIGVLKGEMSQVQAVQRSQQQYESNNLQKKKKKIEYDTKQILHKYNEEVAKINNLKEMANAARDERVVYSNLFNKIEKEIKRYEEVYKQTLIKNQIFLDKKREQSSNSKQQEEPLQTIGESYDNLDRIDIEQPSTHVSYQAPTLNELNRANSKPAPKRSIQVNDVEAFLTNIKQGDKEESTPQRELNSTQSKHKALNKTIQNLIGEKEAEIRKLVIIGECDSLIQLIDHYSTIAEQNEDVIGDVELTEQHICFIEQQIESIRLQKRASEVYETSESHINSEKGPKGSQEGKRDHEAELTQMTQDIADLLGVDTSEGICNEDTLREIDSHVEDLGCCQYERRGRKESKLMSSIDEMHLSNDRTVCEMLEKIEKFNESDKIFDRNTLRQEYQRELGKVRKRGKRTN